MASMEEEELAQLRATHERELAEQRARIEKLQADLAQMQQDTEVLEKEERELERQFGGGGGSDSADGKGDSEGEPSDAGAYVQNILKGLVDGDESKCRMR